MKLLTLAQAAEELGVLAATLRQQIRDGKLKAMKLGSIWVVTRADLNSYKREYHGRKGRAPKD